ncbi:trans-sulfuration enzyme family protein [Pelagibius marinus]|uniref:trans-sulfuration enzyme family protein n=1 Tax=Pelagibius marinus TaxID=2762760 RepID=UPI001872A144|nr:PLP-dependent transferase [Pelagibius marinus]
MHDETRLLHCDSDDEPFRALTTPVHRASTLVFPTVEEFLARHSRFYDGYSYGLYGHPASRSLAKQIATLEGGSRALIVPSGMAAISVVNLALLRPGDHVLIPDAVYAPARAAAEGFLSAMGVTSTFYNSLAGVGIAELFRSTTRLVWVESPASFTMEVQDVPAITAAAHDHGALVAADCTWASPLGFKALRHGADVAVQALSKHIAGHSDLILGSVTVDDETLFRRIKDASRYLGLGVSPDDCFLAQRGLGTLSTRLGRQTESAVKVAGILAEHPCVKQVLYPPLPGDPGHVLWCRDFTGASGVFSVVLEPSGDTALAPFLEQMRLFRLGASWGGLHSLVAPARLDGARSAVPWQGAGPVLRFSIGLEHPDDLIDDLLAGLERYRPPNRAASI